MSKKNCAPLIAHLKRRCDIEVHLGIAHDCRIKKERLFISRLAMLHIDLTGHALYSVDYRRRTFGNLNALQPLAWNI